MRSKIWIAALISITSFVFISCDGSYKGDSMVEAKVVNSWQSGTKNIIQAKTNNFYVEIQDTYFGGLNPKVGDCVKVWASVYNDGSDTPIGNRNIASRK